MIVNFRDEIKSIYTFLVKINLIDMIDLTNN